MLKDIALLSRLQLCNLFGLNEIIHTKDKGKRLRYTALSFLWLLLIALVVFYVGGFAYGYHYLGLGDIVPMYLYTIVSLIMLVLSFFKAGNLLFSMKFYDVMVSLPVSRHAILISRFLSMYVTNLLLGVLILLPGVAVHAYFAKPGINFYLVTLLVLLFTPLLPLTLSSIIGAVIKAISSRMKRKNLVETALTMLFVVLVLAGSLSFGEQAESMDEEMLKNLVNTITEVLGSYFPPALWYHKALQGNLPSLLLVLGIPALIFTVFITILAHFYQDICTSLNAVHAKQNYRLGHLTASSSLKALIKREARLYFSSSLYVTNTIIGYILALLLSVGIAVAGLEAFTSGMGLPEALPLVEQLIPMFLALMFCMCPCIACSISMEGKCFWQLQILPLQAKEIYNGKILWNILLAMPFYVISVLVLSISLRPEPLVTLHYILLPLVYLVFYTVSGLAINLKFPLLNWENEARVVKQSASVLVAMLSGMVAVILPLIPVFSLGITDCRIYFFAVEAILLLMTAILYFRITKKELITI